MFKTAEERDIVDKEQLIAAIEEINPASASEPIRIPHSRSAAEGVKKAAVLTMASCSPEERWSVVVLVNRRVCKQDSPAVNKSAPSSTSGALPSRRPRTLPGGHF